MDRDVENYQTLRDFIYEQAQRNILNTPIIFKYAKTHFDGKYYFRFS